MCQDLDGVFSTLVHVTVGASTPLFGYHGPSILAMVLCGGFSALVAYGLYVRFELSLRTAIVIWISLWFLSYVTAMLSFF